MLNAIMNFLKSLPRGEIDQMILDFKNLEKDGFLESNALLRVRTSELRHSLGDFDSFGSIKWMHNVIHECYKMVAEESHPQPSDQAPSLMTIDEMVCAATLELEKILAKNFGFHQSHIDLSTPNGQADHFEIAAKNLIQSFMDNLGDLPQYSEAKKVAAMDDNHAVVYRAEQAGEGAAVNEM